MTAAVYFEAELAPNPPLTRTALLLVVGSVSLVSFGFAAMFVLRGAWPVTPFFGTDVAVLAWALFASARATRRREVVTVTADEFVLRRIDPMGRESVIVANPYWLRVEHEDEQRLGSELAIVSKGKRFVIGRFLGADERASLAGALRTALGRARAGP